jgi:hypothetical protein
MKSSDELALLFGTLRVGLIKSAFCSDKTWFGFFEGKLEPTGGELPRRIMEYISFCQEWNERARQTSGAESAEFNQYHDIVKSGLWMVEDEMGTKCLILDAPTFFIGDEISWRLASDARN